MIGGNAKARGRKGVGWMREGEGRVGEGGEEKVG